MNTAKLLKWEKPNKGGMMNEPDIDLSRLMERPDELCQQKNDLLKKRVEADEIHRTKDENWDELWYQFYQEQDKIKPPHGTWNDQKRMAYMTHRYPTEWKERQDAWAALKLIDNQIKQVDEEINALDRTIRILQISVSAGVLNEDNFLFTSPDD